MNKNKLAVALFIVLLIAAGYAATARADTVNIGLGKSILNSHSTVGEIGYERKGWEVQATLMGAGDTENGQQDKLSIYSNIQNIVDTEYISELKRVGLINK